MHKSINTSLFSNMHKYIISIQHKKLTHKNGRQKIETFYKYEKYHLYDINIKLIIHYVDDTSFIYNTTLLSKYEGDGILYLILNNEMYVIKHTFLKLVHAMDNELYIRDDYKLVLVRYNECTMWIMNSVFYRSICQKMNIGTSERCSANTSEKDSVDTSEKDGANTSEKDSVDTSEINSVDTSEKDSVDTSEKDGANTSEKDSVDTSEDMRIDKREDMNIGTNEEMRIDTSECMRIDHNESVERTYTTHIHTHTTHINTYTTHMNTLIWNIRKLVIHHQHITRVDISIPSIQYIDMRHNFIRFLSCKNVLEYCDISNNNIQHCNINAKVLILSNNNIKCYTDKYTHDTIELNDNPLKCYRSVCKVLRISNTLLRHVVCTGCVVVECEYNKKVRFYDFLDLKCLKISKHVRYNKNAMKLINPTIDIIKKCGLSSFNNVWNLVRHYKKHKICENARCSGTALIKVLNKIQNYEMYRISGRFEECYIVYKDIPNISGILSSILGNLDSINFVEIIDFIYEHIRKMCIHTSTGMFYILCTTPEKVFIKSYKIKVLVKYFLKQEVILDDSMYIYCNVGQWYVVPLNDRHDASVMKASAMSRVHKCAQIHSQRMKKRRVLSEQTMEAHGGQTYVVRDQTDMEQTMEAHGHKIDMEQTNEAHGCQTRSHETRSHTALPHKTRSHTALPQKTQPHQVIEHMHQKSTRARTIYDIPDVYYEYDVRLTVFKGRNKAYSMSKQYQRWRPMKMCDIHDEYIKKETKSSIITHENCIFMFVRFYSTMKKIHNDMYACNVKKQDRIVRCINRINPCTLVEDNGTDSMIYASQNSKDVLNYAMFYRKLFRSFGVDISIGISCGLFFFKLSTKESKFMGNVLNKASRMAFLGRGVYCCECLVEKYSSVYDFIYMGEREINGYFRCLKIYNVKYKDMLN